MPHFELHDIVRVLRQPERLRHPLEGKEGIVVGSSDGHEEYGVYFSHLREVCAVPASHLEPTGKKARPEDVKTSSRLQSPSPAPARRSAS